MAGKWLRKNPLFGLKKPLKLNSPKFTFSGFFYFLVKFYTNRIYFHILIAIYEFCYNL